MSYIHMAYKWKFYEKIVPVNTIFNTFVFYSNIVDSLDFIKNNNLSIKRITFSSLASSSPYVENVAPCVKFNFDVTLKYFFMSDHNCRRSIVTCGSISLRVKHQNSHRMTSLCVAL